MIDSLLEVVWNDHG